ncbi:hypothetical protein BJ742DRAFT_842192 [Cladochytrium replicatum]|nr:hypothetical protein BJ742DRAFT_842192 [Cladochytrium replicatum]
MPLEPSGDFTKDLDENEDMLSALPAVQRNVAMLKNVPSPGTFFAQRSCELGDLEGKAPPQKTETVGSGKKKGLLERIPPSTVSVASIIKGAATAAEADLRESPVATTEGSQEQSPALQKKQSFSSRAYSIELPKTGKVAESPASVDVMCPTVAVRKISKISITLINGDVKAAIARISAVGKAHLEESSGLSPALPGVRGGPLAVTGGNSHALSITVEARASMYPGSPIKPRSAAAIDTAHAVDEDVFRFNSSGAIKVEGRGKLEVQVSFHPMMRGAFTQVFHVRCNGKVVLLNLRGEGAQSTPPTQNKRIPTLSGALSATGRPGSSRFAHPEILEVKEIASHFEEKLNKILGEVGATRELKAAPVRNAKLENGGVGRSAGGAAKVIRGGNVALTTTKVIGGVGGAAGPKEVVKKAEKKEVIKPVAKAGTVKESRAASAPVIAEKKAVLKRSPSSFMAPTAASRLKKSKSTEELKQSTVSNVAKRPLSVIETKSVAKVVNGPTPMVRRLAQPRAPSASPRMPDKTIKPVTKPAILRSTRSTPTLPLSKTTPTLPLAKKGSVDITAMVTSPESGVVLEIEHGGQIEAVVANADATSNQSAGVCRSPLKPPGTSMDAEAGTVSFGTVSAGGFRQRDIKILNQHKRCPVQVEISVGHHKHRAHNVSSDALQDEDEKRCACEAFFIPPTRSFKIEANSMVKVPIVFEPQAEGEFVGWVLVRRGLERTKAKLVGECRV